MRAIRQRLTQTMPNKPGADTLFAAPLERITAFTFDDKVASVFDDMIQRSVPGYATVVALSGLLAARYAQPHTTAFDLGCSLGATTLAMLKHVDQPGFRVVAVDNSLAMIERCRQNLETAGVRQRVDLVCSDLRHVRPRGASVCVLNFTLQFVAPDERPALLRQICAGLEPGGALILSEKLGFADDTESSLFTDLHHAFKKANGYSELEIAQKRAALESVLIPDTLEAHAARLQAAGFRHSHVWFRCLNFVSILALK